MGQLNKKMVLAPVLAITLALFLAGAVGFLPQTILHSTSQPTPSTATAGLASASDNSVVALLFVIAAIFVGVVAAFLFFSEKKLNKEIKG